MREQLIRLLQRKFAFLTPDSFFTHVKTVVDQCNDEEVAQWLETEEQNPYSAVCITPTGEIAGPKTIDIPSED